MDLLITAQIMSQKSGQSNMKICIRCNKEKVEEDFGWHKKTINRRRTVCRVCRNIDAKSWRKKSSEFINATIRERIRKRKLEWIERKGGKCSSCGGVFHQSVYDFHHLDPKDKHKYTPGQLFTRKKETIETELNKCILLCSNCHRVLHNDY